MPVDVRQGKQNIAQMTAVLQNAGWTQTGQLQFTKPQRGYIIIAGDGWESFAEGGKSVDFGSDADDLAVHIRVAPKNTPAYDEVHYIHYPPEDQEEPGNYFSVVLFKGGQGVWSQLVEEDKLQDIVGEELAAKMRRGEGDPVPNPPNVTGVEVPFLKLDVPQGEVNLSQKDKDWLQQMNIKGSKKAYGLTNEGQQGAVCPNCHNPIADGEMVNYTQSGMEAHVQCPPASSQQPGQQAPGYQSRLNLPPGFKPKQPQVSPNAGRPTASLLKKGDSRFLDDEWRALFQEYGFEQMFNTGDSERWDHPEWPLIAAIDTDDSGEPFWVMMGGDGKPLESGRDTHQLASKLQMQRDTLEPKEKINWKGDVPQFSDEDKAFMEQMKIKGTLIAKVTRKQKMAGSPPRFSFAVPLKAAGAVAFHLAKAGMKDFEVIHFEQDDTSIFAFTNEPEMHVAEEIVKAQFAQQIDARKGMWGTWAPEPEDVTALPETHQQMMSSQKTAEEPYDTLEEEGRQDRELHEDRPEQSFYRGKQFRGPQLVPSRYDHALEVALDALDTLAEIGPSLDIKECARMSAGDLRQFAREQAQGKQSSKVGGQWGDRSEDSDHVLDMVPIDDEGVIDAQAALQNIESLNVEEPEGWDTYLGVVLKLISMGADVPQLYRDRAKNIAVALAGDADYLQEWQNPQSRHAELEREIDILSQVKTAGIHPEADLPLITGPQPTGQRPAQPQGMTDAEVKKMETYRRKKLISWLDEMGFLDAQGNGELLAEYDAGDFWKKDQLYEEARDMIREERRSQTHYRRTMRGPRPYNRKQTSFEKQALDPQLTTLIGGFVSAMLVKWLGQEYSKRWGSLAQEAAAKAERTLQQKGVLDLGTLDKYAQEAGTNRMGAFLRLAGQSLLLAAAMTTGIAGAKLLSGDAKAEAPVAKAPVQQMTITDEVDAPVPQAPAAPKPHRPSKEQLKQQQKQQDEQVMEKIRQQDKDRNPQNVV